MTYLRHRFETTTYPAAVPLILVKCLLAPFLTFNKCLIHSCMLFNKLFPKLANTQLLHGYTFLPEGLSFTSDVTLSATH